MKTRFSASARRGQIVILLLVVLALSSAAYSYFGIRKVAKFRDHSIERKYEGSLSEDLGFLTVLTTAASKTWDSHKNPEAERVFTREIRKELVEIRDWLEGLGRLDSPEELDLLKGTDLQSRSIEEMDLNDLLVMMTLRSTGAVPIDVLGLVAVETKVERPTPRPSLESDPKKNASSFVFVPSPLVAAGASEGEQAGLSKPIANEVVFSKIAVDEMLNRSGTLERNGIFQVYFVPSSGLARLAKLTTSEPFKVYGGHFSPVKSFSDRTYFGKTHESKPDRFRETEPYIDTAGGGLVKTYTVFVKNEALGVYGLIGFDRRLSDLMLWDTDFGTSPLLRDFEMIRHVEGEAATPDTDALVRRAIDYIESNIEKCSSGIRRLPLKDAGDRGSAGETIFTVPLGETETGAESKRQFVIFIFDADKVASKYNWLLGLFIVSLTGVGVMAYIANRELVAREELKRGKEQAERFYEDVVNHLHGGFALVDQRNTILAGNPKFKAIIGEEDPVGRRINDFLIPESVEAFESHKEEENRESLKTDGRGFEFPATIKHSDGSTSPTILSSAPIELLSGAEARVLILLPSEELEITIGSKFLHSFSHALKTPAHSIMLLSETFRRRKNQPKFDHYCWLMEQEIQEFSGLINNILEFSELEIQDVRLKLESVNLGRMLRGLAKVAKKRAEKKGLRFYETIPETAHCEVDEQMIRIVFNNLIDNALKYTDEGFVFIRLTDNPDFLEIAFHDSGVGVDDEDRPKIFDVFFRSESKKVRARDGIGIGLHVSKRYVALHGGTLEYQPLSDEKSSAVLEKIKNAQGSVFVMTLPKKPRSSGSAETTAEQRE